MNSFVIRRYVLLIHDFLRLNKIPTRKKKVTPRFTLRKPLNQKENITEREIDFVVMEYIIVFILVPAI